jgi:hypothetical protein
MWDGIWINSERFDLLARRAYSADVTALFRRNSALRAALVHESEPARKDPKPHPVIARRRTTQACHAASSG